MKKICDWMYYNKDEVKVLLFTWAVATSVASAVVREKFGWWSPLVAQAVLAVLVGTTLIVLTIVSVTGKAIDYSINKCHGYHNRNRS